jgi:PKD repeat protein
VDWAVPARSTYGLSGHPSQVLAVAPYDCNLCDFSFNCIPQPGTANRLDAISDRVMYRLAYWNYGNHQALVVNHTVDVDGTDHAGVRWYELHSSGGGWSVHQEGTYAPDADGRWMGSVALDGGGNLAVGYSTSGADTYPSLRYAGRLAGDPLGELTQGEATLVSGSGSVTSGVRWGDYSSVSVDPVDDCTFWFTGEYQHVNTPYGDWRTRIGTFRFPSCGLVVSIQASPASGAVPLTVQFAAHGTGGSAPYTYELDFGDGATGAGETLAHTYTAAGSYTARVTLRDSSGGTASATADVLALVDLPQITRISKVSSPFRLKVEGESFHAGCTVKVNGAPAPQTQYVSESLLKAGSGGALKVMLPKGQPVQVTVVNNDDGGVSAPFSFTR